MKFLGRIFSRCFAVIMLLGCNIQLNAQSLRFFSADNPKFQYLGRIDFSNPALPKYWAPGVYVTTSFNGSSCKFIVQDEVPNPNAHNYVEVVIDNYIYHRIRLQQKKRYFLFKIYKMVLIKSCCEKNRNQYWLHGICRDALQCIA